MPLGDCPTSLEDLRALGLDQGVFGPAPIHLMVPNERLRHGMASFAYRVHSAMLPHESFHRVGTSTCVASPEYCLMQAARVYGRFRLMELCMEFLGMYSIDRKVKEGLVKREWALTSVEKIRAFAMALVGEPGRSRLLSVLPYLEEGSRSPMETRQYLLLSLPKRFGGYGLTGAKLNQRLVLTQAERRIAKRASIECDLCWPDHNIVIEYDGEDYHSAPDARMRDASKRNVLTGRGICVLTVTSEQIMDVDAFDVLARGIASITGHRMRRFPDDWIERRARLRAEIFASMR